MLSNIKESKYILYLIFIVIVIILLVNYILSGKKTTPNSETEMPGLKMTLDKVKDALKQNTGLDLGEINLESLTNFVTENKFGEIIV